MTKLLKVSLLTILILLILAGAFYMLIYINILKPPAILSDIPVIGKIISKEETPKLDKAAILEQENKRLKDSIDEKNQELQEKQIKVKDLEKKLTVLSDNENKLKEEIARLNEEIISIKTHRDNKAAAYKDMAKYYEEMNAKDAADIISRLEMDHIIGILNEMKTDVVADILQNMPKDKAAEVTKKMLVVSP